MNSCCDSGAVQPAAREKYYEELRPLNLSPPQKADLVAFLKRPLTDPRVAVAAAPFDRPTLYGESNRVPQITGNGVAGSGAITPQVVANEPPLMGNPGFTVAVANALGGAQAVLVIDNSDPGSGAVVPHAASFVVELPPGPLSRAAAARYVRAIRTLAACPES